MSDFNLKLLIDEADLMNVRSSGQRITLAKPVNSEASPSVVWLSIDPFEGTDVSWKEEYGIYASTTAIVEGASIAKLTETDIGALDGANYTFTSNAVFEGPFTTQGVPPGTFGAQNDMPYSDYPLLTFGLTQSAMVNQKPADRKPISATPVLATQFSSMTPFTTVYIWLQSQFASETIITKITGKSAKAKFGGGITDITLKYNPSLGLFVAYNPQG